MITQEESNYRLQPVDGNIAEKAYAVYNSMINNSKHFGEHFCTLCQDNKSKGIFIKNHYHGSDLGKCYRAVQFSILHPIVKEPDPIRLMFLQDGHNNEKILIDLLGMSYLTHSHNKEFLIRTKVTLAPSISETITIACHPDLIVENSLQFLMEFKSVKDWFYKNIAMKGLIPKVYYGQIQSYLEALNIETGLLLVKNRHSSEVLPPFIVARNREWFNQRITYLAGIQYMNKQPQVSILPREYTNKNCGECKFCDYNKPCWEK